MSSIRQFWVVAHRWAGLTIALFLIVAGSTGALLAFHDELYDATAPWRIVAPPHAGAQLLDPLALTEAARAAAPAGYTTNGLSLDVAPGRVFDIGLEPRDPERQPYLNMALNPYTGAVVQQYEYGNLSYGWHQVMPFILHFHYSLALGDVAIWAFGIAALIWTMDCFVGFYLTLPPVRWRGWGKSWRVRWRASGTKLNFDLHRAGGLWLWPILLIFAWSSVAFNLRDVYEPVMRAVGAEPVYASLPDAPTPANFMPDYPGALTNARRLAAEAATGANASISGEGYLFFNREKNVFEYSFTTDRDFTSEGHWSLLVFSPNGTVRAVALADGGLDQGGADNWLLTLHMAQVGGLPYRIFVSLLGLAITMLSVTGVIIWMKKRSARLLRGRRTVTPVSAAIAPSGIARSA
jgi:uncharacterized iron-regulated membrane protein